MEGKGDLSESLYPEPLTVVPGQEFPLFDPQRTEINAGRERLSQNIVLQLEGLEPFELNIHLAEDQRTTQDLAPFSSDGYKITSEDLLIPTRKSKQREFPEKGYLDEDDSNYLLEIGASDSQDVRAKGQPRVPRQSVTPPQDISGPLNRARLQLKFPNGEIYESLPWWKYIPHNTPSFDHFYRPDVGLMQLEVPLNNGFPCGIKVIEEGGEKKYFGDGLRMFLPFSVFPPNKEQLAQIKAEFLELPPEETT